jgi:hypothetical protein
MKTETVVYCVVALLLGMLLANMLKSVCGCKVVEGNNDTGPDLVPLNNEPDGDPVLAVKRACGGTGYYYKIEECHTAVSRMQAVLDIDWFWDQGHAAAL